MISLRNIRKSFGGHEVLNDISFEIAEGERVSLLGPGGCGKSIILKTIIGLLEPDDGEVSLMGLDMRHSTEEQREHVLRSVGMAFQQGALFDFMTVRENLLFAMEHMSPEPKDVMEGKITTLLNGVKLPRSADQYPFELSGGMQRRVGIARALSTSPKIAIFDEPTSGLDPVTSTVILNMIHALAGGGGEVTQLVATSNVEIAIRFAERIIIVNEGKVVADGHWKELLVSGPKWVQHFLSVRLIGLDLDYAKDLNLPETFINQHWEGVAQSP